LFVHTSLVDLAANMIFLAAVGPAVERVAGSPRFLLVYFISGSCGVFAHWMLSPANLATAPLVGASAAIAGCIGYYTLRYFRVKVPLFPGLSAPIAAIVTVWILAQIFGLFSEALGMQVGISFLSHVGGFVAGIAMAFVLKVPSALQEEDEAAVQQVLAVTSPTTQLQEANLRLAKKPKDLAALHMKAEALERLGDTQKEADTLIQILEVSGYADAGAVERLHQLGATAKLSEGRRIHTALNLKDTHPELAVFLLESVAFTGAKAAPTALLELATLFQRLPEKQKRYLIELQSRFSMDPATEIARKRGWLGSTADIQDEP
jgi:hypothetical protein